MDGKDVKDIVWWTVVLTAVLLVSQCNMSVTIDDKSSRECEHQGKGQ